MSKNPTKTVAGFFSPQMMQRLVPVNGLLTEETVAGIHRSPDRAIALMNKRFADVAEGYRGNMKMGYDPHVNLLSILSLPCPLLPIGSMLTAIGDARLLNDPVFARREALAHVCAQAAPRRGTLAAVPLASLIRSNGTFTLRIPGLLFKNRNAKRFAQGKVYEKVLSDHCGCYEVLDRYLDFGRKAVGMADHPALFVTSGGSMSEGQIYGDVSVMTTRFLSEDGLRGVCMPGVAGFGPGGYRHILATHFLKQSRDLLVAAEAIHDDPKTVFDHYARYAPEDLRRELDRQWRSMSSASRTMH